MSRDQLALFEDEHPERDSRRTRLRVDADGVIREPDGTEVDAQSAMDALRWITPLKSSGAPHQYTLRDHRIAGYFDLLADVVAQHPDSFLAYHLGYTKPMRYLEILGWRLWRTASGGRYGRVAHMLNRTRPEWDVEGTVRPVELGPADWQGGPPWLPLGSPWPPGWQYEPDNKERGQHAPWFYRPETDPRRRYRCVRCATKFFWDPDRPCPKCGFPASSTLGE